MVTHKARRWVGSIGYNTSPTYVICGWEWTGADRLSKRSELWAKVTCKLCLKLKKRRK